MVFQLSSLELSGSARRNSKVSRADGDERGDERGIIRERQVFSGGRVLNWHYI